MKNGDLHNEISNLLNHALDNRPAMTTNTAACRNCVASKNNQLRIRQLRKTNLLTYL